ncbi:hypothetical protein PORY_000914 [Pneumocystis oryctolagi]|uniref:Uncharacterized protein n=1 Tax=Pneumocystis oryctolagi TaxID=42067 RepID=A0ACB7CJ28_9ASCO|nr:hypothetical protein PORY_000914 [Pneumocystis oryctolagi]
MNAVIPGIYLKDFSKVLLCLSKIGDELSIETKKNKVLLSSLNASKSVFGLITFDCSRFFEKYEYLPCESSCEISSKNNQTLKCKVQIRLLLAIFKYRSLENKDTKNISVQKCELKLIPPNSLEKKCRFTIRFLCKYGILKTYNITYEQSQVMHALCNKSLCKNKWKINSRIFKEHLDHFSTRAEELTLMIQNDKLLLTKVLKQPIQTAILIDKRDFEEIDFEEHSIITFPLKEFKAVVILGDSMNMILNAYFNTGGAPILFEFEKDIFSTRFIFATTSESIQENASTFNKSFNSNNFQHSQNHVQINDIQFSRIKDTSDNEMNSMNEYDSNIHNAQKSKNSVLENISNINNMSGSHQDLSNELEYPQLTEKMEKSNAESLMKIDSDEEVEPTQQSNIKGIFD